MSRLSVKSLILVGIALGLMGCSSGANLLSGKSNVPAASSVQVGNNLAMPPDLQLQAPGATTDAYQPNGYVAPVSQPQTAAPTKIANAAPQSNIYGGAAAPAPAAPAGDVFDQAGISKVKEDGTKKTAAELNKELSAYYMAKKKASDPKYGTVSNIGAIFQ